MLFRSQIREILELDLESWTSYQDIYQYFVSISSNQKDLKWRRSVIGSIEYFDIYGLFPDRRRNCSFIEPRGAYHSLNHVYQQLIDYYKTYAERIGKTKDTTIDSESHSGSVFFYHLQQRDCCNLESTEEDDVLSFFLDEIGYLPIDKEDSNMFFQLIDMRYEKKSTVLTTNMNFNEWDGVFYDAVVANAIMDRVLHHAHVIPISGKSYRLKDHLGHND